MGSVLLNMIRRTDPVIPKAGLRHYGWYACLPSLPSAAERPPSCRLSLPRYSLRPRGEAQQVSRQATCGCLLSATDLQDRSRGCSLILHPYYLPIFSSHEITFMRHATQRYNFFLTQLIFCCKKIGIFSKNTSTLS